MKSTSALVLTIFLLACTPNFSQTVTLTPQPPKEVPQMVSADFSEARIVLVVTNVRVERSDGRYRLVNFQVAWDEYKDNRTGPEESIDAYARRLFKENPRKFIARHKF